MSQCIPFSKLSGAGNDFVVIDNRKKIVRSAFNRAAIKLCAPKTGIGADGLLLLEESATHDFRMRIFNPDGSEAEMCGNGARCIARFAYLKKIARSAMVFETKAGPIAAQIKNTHVKVQLGDPLGFREVTVSIGKNSFNVFFVNTGVPHAVVLVDDLKNAAVVEWGRGIRSHSFFKPAGTNVDFVSRIDSHTISVRTYERGVENETLACGTGSVASALISAKKNGVLSPVNVETRGGEILKVYFDYRDGTFSNVYLEGEVKHIFDGIVKEL